MRRRTIILSAAIAAMLASGAALAEEPLKLKELRAMSDEELYALAETLPDADEDRLYAEAKAEFPDDAFALQAGLNRHTKRKERLEACEAALESDVPDEALASSIPGRYWTLLRITAVPTEDVLDLPSAERQARSRQIAKDTNKLLRELRDCRRRYRTAFGSE